ncbi:MAG: hypothetical protein NWF10_05230 [Candidatus Bathyarchaeota archaeon]|nr:hypothetical protein [Candidatus Bathyarchaeota archaeon]
MDYVPKVDVDKIIAEYNLDVDSTTLIKVENLKDSTSVFRVDRSDLIDELYIIDTVQGKNIACHPHIFGKKLKNQAFIAALEAATAMSQLTALSTTNPDSIVVENVLRAAPGYELHTAFRELNAERAFKDVWIRLKYEKPSYRSHSDESALGLNIFYEDFKTLPQQKEIVVLKPDTEATGKTGQKSIERIVKKCEEVKSTIKEIILYGFISIPALKAISETSKLHGIKLVAFSIGDITELAHNSYDMTLYGIDESLWSASGKIRKLGSIVDPKTLDRYLPEFIPGSDQPGDWSDRQTSVHVTKEKKQQIRVDKHLRNSIKLIESLKRISNFTPWQKLITEKELQLLYSILQRFNNSF